MLAMIASDFGSTGSREMSWFHGLSDGNGRQPLRLPFGPRSGFTCLSAAITAAATTTAPLTNKIDRLSIPEVYLLGNPEEWPFAPRAGGRYTTGNGADVATSGRAVRAGGP